MSAEQPAVNLSAPPGQRRATLELAREAERRGFAGISVPSPFGNMAQCLGLAFATERIPFATAIAPIYSQSVEEFALTAAYLHEVSGGRFQFGIGIAHAPLHQRIGITPGKPLGDVRAFVTQFKSYKGLGELPPVVLATLRRRMIALAGEIAEGMVFANGSLSHMRDSLSALPAAKRDDPNFFIGARIRTCISDDPAEARTAVRRTMVSYAEMPNYRAYWKEAGYVEEMTAIEAAIAAGRPEEVPKFLHDRWLADTTLCGSATQIRDGIEAWRDAGIRVPTLVPLSADGRQSSAMAALFAAFAD